MFSHDAFVFQKILMSICSGTHWSGFIPAIAALARPASIPAFYLTTFGPGFKPTSHRTAQPDNLALRLEG